MAAGSMSEVVQHLRQTMLLRENAGLTDGQLLERFIATRDNAALAVLVRRHAPMVWGVCRRLLHRHQDAEDAFQATFLVLVRKAASVMPREMVVNWLHGVAYQTARKLRATTAKTMAREKQQPIILEAEAEATASQPYDDLLPLLDQELARLPDKYRVPVLLCDLEGKSRKEAARQLGLPEGTVASRLSRARTMLAKRLTRHGAALSADMLGTALAQEAGAAGAPPPLVAATIKAAQLVAAGHAGAVSVATNPKGRCSTT